MARKVRWLTLALLLGLVVLLAAPVVPSSYSSSSAPVGPRYEAGDVSSPATSVVGATNPSAISSVEVAAPFRPAPSVVALGPYSPSASMTVLVGLSTPDPEALAGLVSAEYAAGSPLFHAFRTPAELRSAFGPSATEVTAATDYFEERGLSVTVSADGLVLSVSGPSGELGDAFHTNFIEYRDALGRTFVSHPTPATLPSVASWSGAFGLGNVTPITPTLRGSPPLDVRASPVCSGTPAPLVPCQVWQAYNMSSLIGAGTNGSGFRIAVVDPYASAEGQPALSSDLAAFSLAAGIPVGHVQFVYPIPNSGNLNVSSNPGWDGEDALDLEWAHVSAPGATVEMTFSPNSGVGLYQAVDWVVAHHAADVISMSWGEPDVGDFNSWDTPCASGCNASTDGSYAILTPVLEYAAAEGISVFAASGDCGAFDGTTGFSTNFPASDPTVTGVGGTVLSVDASGNYLSESGWSGNPNGGASPGCTNQGGSGGGYSPFPELPWQVGLLPSGSDRRGVPDVSLDAGTAVEIYLGGIPTAVLGTSVATPIWAGIAAVADQSTGVALGDLNPALYAIAAVPSSYSRDFHDVTQGNNGYPAGPGWDPVTGLGTPRVASLVADLAHPSPVAPYDLSTFVYGAPRFGRAPLTTAFHLNATGGTGVYPIEGVSFGDGNASFAPGGATSHTYLHPGVYLAESYVTDSRANSSVSPPIVIVVGGGEPLRVNLTANTQTPASGGTVNFTATVVGGTAPYTYNFTFGDGTFEFGAPAATVSHLYSVRGSYCAAVIVSDAATPVDGGASSRVAVGAGGATLPDCQNDTTRLVVQPGPAPAPRDAPADFPNLLSSFRVSGGPSGASSLPPSLEFTANDPYAEACRCSIFRTPGSYAITAYANDSVNQEATATETITVAPPLVAAFSPSVTYGVAPLTITFQATARGGYDASAANATWSSVPMHLQNWSTVSGATARITFSAAGEYTVVGHLGDRGHGNASEAFVITVFPAGSGPGPFLVLGTTIAPAVDVPLGASVNLSGRFFLTNGTDVSNTPVWRFGNDSGAYRLALNWTFLNVSDLDNGSLFTYFSWLPSGDASPPVNSVILPDFAATEPGGFLPRVSALSVRVSGGPVVGEAPVAWTGNATVTGPGSVSVAWSFGNGTASTNLSVHQLVPAGLHTVSFDASDSWGDSATREFPFAVAPALQANGSVTPLLGTAPLTLMFNLSATGGGPPYQYVWDFGDNTSINGIFAPRMNGTHAFDSPGAYNVTVTVSDGFGRTWSDHWNVTVRPPSASGGASVPWTLVFVIVGVGGAAAAAAGVVLWTRRRRRAGGIVSP
jgi:PKD repeat protein